MCLKPALFVLAAGMDGCYGGLKQMDAVGLEGETIIDCVFMNMWDFAPAVFPRLRTVFHPFLEKAIAR